MAENKHRWKIQLGAALASNPFLMNFLHGRISRTGLKAVCVPGLNCYSCPAAATSCPIGALQAVIGSSKFQFAWYVVGFLIFAGACWGGWCAAFCARSDGSRSRFTKSLQKVQHQAGPHLDLSEIRDSGALRHCPAYDGGQRGGNGRPVLLQVYLPRRHPGGRHPAGAGRCGHPGRPGRTIYLEEPHPAGDSSAGGVFLPAFLQVAVPAGGSLRAVQQNFHLPPAGGLGPVHRLRGVQSCVQDGCGCVQDAQPC